jgi:AraC family transcriptional regulator
MAHMKDFLAAYPDIRLDATLTDATVDVIQTGADVAVRIGALVDSTLVARKLAPHRRILVASPSLSRYPPPPAGLPPAGLRRVRDHIEAHLGEDTSLHTLAGLAGLSPHHFCRAFKESTGLPPHQYVLWRRIERAKALLADGRLSVTEVALAAGFSGPSQFAHAFRRFTGRAPSAYRKSLL